MAGTGFPALDAILACREAETHNHDGEFGACTACGEYGDGPTNSWVCGVCGDTVYRFRGESDVSCDCGAQYNAGGQRLRDDWRGNPSTWDSEIGDMEGYEMQHGGDW
jgi:hypothetical protein